MNYDARDEHKKNRWLGVSGSVLVIAAIIGCMLQIVNN